ncbi:uncharacterized protein LOC132610962 [Lycium barbarum]|uniref:uncharacterized protein LOC132610962 n=1 Tax=Lycium barbarum TaxID=112863 RepID=UPI00293F10A7|nr:uncharacterized protein LOC132610962 [Lycium barbarum]
MDLLRDSLNKVKLIQERLLIAQSRQNSYGDRKVRDLEFIVSERVLLKVLPMRFGKKGKLSPRHIGPFEIVEHISPFEIVEHIGEVAYELAFPPGLSEPDYEEEPIAILDRQMRKLRSKEIVSVKVQWRHHSVEEATRETELDMRMRYPQLFTDSALWTLP